MQASDGKQYNILCADTETLLYIIQYIPSKNADPFKQWLASLGAKAVKEEALEVGEKIVRDLGRQANAQGCDDYRRIAKQMGELIAPIAQALGVKQIH